MSTWWYFECLSHTPPLSSGDEFTQHTDDAAFRRGIELAQNRPVEPYVNDTNSDLYFENNARRFLAGHPVCDLGLVNEYDERRPVRVEPTTDEPTVPEAGFDAYYVEWMDGKS